VERHAGNPKRGKQYIDLKEEKDSSFDFAQIASLSLETRKQPTILFNKRN
jgi:hypothetical protein